MVAFPEAFPEDSETMMKAWGVPELPEATGSYDCIVHSTREWWFLS